MTKKTALFVFLIFSLLYLGLVLIEFETITWWLKPFIIPLLSISVFLSGKLKFKPLLISALFFSWIGDVVLLFANQGVIYFIIGLVSFLIAHLFYIILFSKLQKVINLKYKRFIPLVLLYLVGFLYFLWEKLGGMKIPVIIYALVISTMLLVAIKGYFTWNSKSGKLLLIGAVFFVLSDSILAINKFYVTIYLSSFWIMSTYITALFLIVKGVLNLNSKQ
ncbi:MAG TPA: lysoplasmalogenase [Flavobacterium sp.]|nr:lysoplasmalogenase [Flavobacterium sp.]